MTRETTPANAHPDKPGAQPAQSKWHARHRELWLAVAEELRKTGSRDVIGAKYEVFGRTATEAEKAKYESESACYACLACMSKCRSRGGEPRGASHCPVEWSCEHTEEEVDGLVPQRPCTRKGSEYDSAHWAATPEAAAEAAETIAYLPWDASKETMEYPETGG